MKKPASGIAGCTNKVYDILYKTNISDVAKNVNIPEWMSDKLAKIAVQTDIWAFEQEAAVLLASEIQCFPEQARVLPETFRQKALAGKPRDFEPLERAAIIIMFFEWRRVCDIWHGTSLEEKVAAQFDVLASLLQEGGAE